MDKDQIGMCGAYCGVCQWKEKTGCKGCQFHKGKMFYGTCPVAKCCSGKSLLHCGLCQDLPCEALKQAFNHPEYGDNGERFANLKAWARGEDNSTVGMIVSHYLKLGNQGVANVLIGGDPDPALNDVDGQAYRKQ